MQVLSGGVCAGAAHIADYGVLGHGLPRLNLRHFAQVHICHGEVGGLFGFVVFAFPIPHNGYKAAAAGFSGGLSVFAVVSDEPYSAVSEGVYGISAHAVDPVMPKAEFTAVLF